MNQYVQLQPSSPVAAESANGLDARFVAQAAIVGIFLLLFIVSLGLAQTILLPVISAVIIGVVLDPLLRHAERYHIPRVAFATMLVGVLLAAVYLGFLAVSDPIVEAVKQAPQTAELIKSRLQELQNNFAAVRYLLSLFADGDSGLKVDIASIIKPVLAFLTPALSELAVFFATLFLFLIDQTKLRRKLILVFPSHEARLRAIHVLTDINNALIRYIGAVAVINLGVGTVTGLGLYLLQFPNPVFWGIAAFVCNFVPYIGPALIVCAFLIVGLVNSDTIAYAILVPSLFVALTTVEGHFITPNVIGRNFDTSALAAFLSLAFWTWLWGPVGAFLSIPMLIIATVVLSDLLPAKKLDLPE